MKKRNLVLFLIGSLLFTSSLSSQTKHPIFKKIGVKKEEAQNEVGRAIFSIGFSAPAVGNDPCQGVEKTMGGLKTYSLKGEVEFTGLPTKPSISIGKQGQVMEGEVDRTEENKKVIEEMDSAMNDFLNNDTQSAEHHLNNAREINDQRTRRDMEEVKKSENPTKEQLDRLAEDIHTGWVIGRNDDNLDRQAWQEFAKGAVRSTEYPSDRKEWIKKTIYTPNPEIVSCDSPVCKKADELNEKFGVSIKKRKEEKISIQEKRGGKSLDRGIQPAQNYPDQSTKSGYEREKSSKTEKGRTIINPSESASGRGSRGIDFCGRNLPTPEQAESMGFDPGRITDPANRDWTGRIEQRGTEKTLTWSKTILSAQGNIKVEYTYKEGEIVAINYEFFDRNGNKIGYAFYDGKKGVVEAKRLR